ncbi:hypothetical protein NE626_12190, partial [Intestinimonas massiliensis]|uniref:hypothetical protein n=1 Tax=Intestinimonas massiliensis (ex Afouda et al. 2020) TaxID=1673721 RepID=UPI00210B086D
MIRLTCRRAEPVKRLCRCEGYQWEKIKATPRNDMKKPHHLPISANCGGGSAYFRCMGKLNQAGKQRLS